MDNSIIFDRYYNSSLRYLSYRPRSEKEVLDYLNKKTQRNPKLTQDIILSIMAKLQKYKFINDDEFVRFWVEQRTKIKHKPQRVIEFELKQKGINKDLIEKYLVNSEDSKKADLESAKKLAEKKLDFYRNLDPKKRQEKVTNYLLRKGFNYDIVKKVIKY